MPVLNSREVPKSSINAIKIVSFLRLCIGIYSEDMTSNNRFKWMIRLYCLLYNSCFLTMIANDPYMNTSVKWVIWMDTIPYVIFALINKESSLNYLRLVASECKNAKEERWLLYSILFPISWSLGNFMIYSILNMYLTSLITTPVATVYQIFGIFSGELKRIAKLFNLCLLVCDLISLQRRLREVGFRFQSGLENSTPDYVNMFQNVRNRFRRVELSTKVLILLRIIHYISMVIVVLLRIILSLREGGFQNVEMIEVAVIFYNGIDTFVAISLLEAVVDIEEKIIKHVMDLCICYPNRSERKEMRRLTRYIRAEPLRLTLWRIVPLNSSLALSCIALTITYIIAVLQFT